MTTASHNAPPSIRLDTKRVAVACTTRARSVTRMERTPALPRGQKLRDVMLGQLTRISFGFSDRVRCGTAMALNYSLACPTYCMSRRRNVNDLATAALRKTESIPISAPIYECVEQRE